MRGISHHAVARAKQRYDVAVTQELADAWLGDIACNRARLVVSLDRTNVVYDVDHQGRRVRLLYDRDGRFVKTVLSRTGRHYP